MKGRALDALRAVSDGDGRFYALDVIGRTSATYATLYVLEDEGYIAATREPSGRCRYNITLKGQAALAAADARRKS
jgi:hypothetical protein